MTPAQRKAAFCKLSKGQDPADLALFLGVSVDTLRGWHKPGNPRAPSDKHLHRLRMAVITDLTERLRNLGLQVIPYRNPAGEQNSSIAA